MGIGYSQHIGMVIVADGTPEVARRLEHVLTTDLGTGIARHADIGYERAIEVAKEHGIKLLAGLPSQLPVAGWQRLPGTFAPCPNLW